MFACVFDDYLLALVSFFETVSQPSRLSKGKSSNGVLEASKSAVKPSTLVIVTFFGRVRVCIRGARE